MDNTEELILKLIDYAKAGEHKKVDQLRFFNEYISGRITYGATKKVVNILKVSTNNLFKNYCKAVQDQQADVNMLLAYKQLQHAVNFYKEELTIIKNALVDYENYLCADNFLKAFLFGEERTDWDMTIR